MRLRAILRRLWRPGAAALPPGEDIDLAFASRTEWQDWVDQRPRALDPNFAAGAAERIRAAGFIEPLTRVRVHPDDIEGDRKQWREGLFYRGVPSRGRAVMRLIETTFGAAKREDVRVYAPESVSPFARRMRRLFPRFIGSEYSAHPSKPTRRRSVRYEDLTRLSFADASFDLVSTNEVLEHVPDLDAALREICRVLAPGGWHIGTHPFNFAPHSEVLTRLVGGKIEHVKPAEYHVNPFEPGGSLVFEIPGWDILDRCRAAGFSEAVLRFLLSETYGCVAEDVGGVLVLCCRK